MDIEGSSENFDFFFYRFSRWSNDVLLAWIVGTAGQVVKNWRMSTGTPFHHSIQFNFTSLSRLTYPNLGYAGTYCLHSTCPLTPSARSWGPRVPPSGFRDPVVLNPSQLASFTVRIHYLDHWGSRTCMCSTMLFNQLLLL